MKTFLIACLIFVLLLTGVFWNTHFVIGSLSDLRDGLAAIPLPPEEAEDLSAQSDGLVGIDKLWQKYSTGLSMSVNHADLMEAELHFATAKAAAAAGNRDDYLIAIADLDYALGHIAEMSSLSFKNLL